MLEIKNWYDCSKCGKALDDGEFEKIARKIVCFKCMVKELKDEIARLKCKRPNTYKNYRKYKDKQKLIYKQKKRRKDERKKKR